MCRSFSGADLRRDWVAWARGAGVEPRRRLVFEAIGGAAVAARSTSTDADDWFVATYSRSDVRSWRVAPPTSSSIVVRAVWALSGNEPHALVCDTSEVCTVYGVDPEVEANSDARLQPLAGLELPPEAVVDGIVSQGTGLDLCVFGEGLYCWLGDRWEVAVEGRRIEDVVLELDQASGDGRKTPTVAGYQGLGSSSTLAVAKPWWECA